MDAPCLDPFGEGEEEDDRRRLPHVAQRQRAPHRDRHGGVHVERTLVEEAGERAADKYWEAEEDAAEGEVGEGVRPELVPLPMLALQRREERRRREEEKHAHGGDARAQAATYPADLDARDAVVEARAEEGPVERARERLRRRLLVVHHRDPLEHQVDGELAHAREAAELLLDDGNLGLAAHTRNVDVGHHRLTPPNANTRLQCIRHQRLGGWLNGHLSG